MLPVRSAAIESRSGTPRRRFEQRQRPLDELVVGAAGFELLDGLRGDAGGVAQCSLGVGRRRLGQSGLGLAAAAQLGVHAEHDRPQAADVEGGDGPLAGGVVGFEELFERLVEGLERRSPGLGSVQNPEARVDADRDRVGGEQAVAEAVDRRHPSAAESRQQLARALGPGLGPALQLGPEPLAQLGRRLVGEGEGEDGPGGDPLVADQPAVAIDHHAGLAGAGAGLDQDLGCP